VRGRSIVEIFVVFFVCFPYDFRFPGRLAFIVGSLQDCCISSNFVISQGPAKAELVISSTFIKLLKRVIDGRPGVVRLRREAEFGAMLLSNIKRRAPRFVCLGASVCGINLLESGRVTEPAGMNRLIGDLGASIFVKLLKGKLSPVWSFPTRGGQSRQSPPG
jgi:hypothetical protein